MTNLTAIKVTKHDGAWGYVSRFDGVRCDYFTVWVDCANRKNTVAQWEKRPTVARVDLVNVANI